MEDTFSHIDEKIQEKELLSGILSGKRDGARCFLEAYGGIIKKAVLSVGIRSNAVETEDLFMGAVENLLRNDMKAVRSFNGKCKFSTFLFAICRRHAISTARHEHLRKNEPFTECTPIDIFDDIESIDETQRAALLEAINRCDIDTQLFIRMMFFDQRSTTEIMRFFGWNSENTVYSKKNKTIEKLRKSMKKILLNRN